MKLNVGEISVWAIVELVEIRQFGVDREADVLEAKSPESRRIVVEVQLAGRAGTATESKCSA